jgi:hypothetical protein
MLLTTRDVGGPVSVIGVAGVHTVPASRKAARVLCCGLSLGAWGHVLGILGVSNGVDAFLAGSTTDTSSTIISSMFRAYRCSSILLGSTVSGWVHG